MRTQTASQIQIATVTGLSLVSAYALAFYWQLDKPFWAGFTVFMVSLPSIGQSLQKGLLRITGTFLGASIGLLLFMIFPQERFPLLLFLSMYLSIMMYFMSGSRLHGYFFFITALVSMIIILVGSDDPEAAFSLAVYRSEETLLGITVYTLITLIVEPKLSFRTFTGNMEKLFQAHLELFLQAQEQEKEGILRDMYAKYNEIRNTVDATEQLLPAVKLENSQVYADRTLWRSAIACSADLFETQRKWTGTLVAMKTLNLETLFPDFTSRMAELEQLFARLATTSVHALPNGNTAPPSPAKHAYLECASGEQLTATERGLISTAQALYQRQIQLCQTLNSLADYLLHNGPKPVHINNMPEKQTFFFSPEQRASLIQTFVLFWITTGVWVFFDPPGTESIRFIELTLVLGLFELLTGSDPWHSVLYFLYGIILTGLLYIFVYPLITHFLLFLALMFVIAFILSFWFSHPNQKAMKFGFTMPWLSICNFTNTPNYSFIGFASNAFTLFLGISLVACIRYVLFSQDENAVFTQKQISFFHVAQRLMRLMREYHGRNTSLFHRLVLSLAVHRVYFLAAQIGIMAKKVSHPFMAPAIAQILGTEIADIAASLSRLQRDLAISGSVLPAPAPAPVSHIDGTPHDATGIVTQAEKLRQLTDRLFDDLSIDSRTRLHNGVQEKHTQRMEASCGSIVRALSIYIDVVRSLPGQTAGDARQTPKGASHAA